MSHKIARSEGGPESLIPLTVREVEQTAESVVQDAVNETGFGKFNLKVMAVSSLIYMNVAFSIISIGFILPAATCDFKMTTVDKGRLSAVSILGMLCCSYFWGCYAAIKGRKISLLVSLFLHGSTELLASVIPFYWIFMFLKFVSGATMNGQLTIVFLYLGEFQPSKQREKVLSWMELGWVLGTLFVAIVGWCIIPLDVNFETEHFFFHSWNLFVMICSFPALLIGAWLLSFPETPKYLADTGRKQEMLRVLMKMYAVNTGNPAIEYIDKAKNSENKELAEVMAQIANAKSKDVVKQKSFRVTINNICTQTMMIIKPPYLQRTLVICLISCFVTSSYYTLVLWLPELFNRYTAFEELYPNRTASVCTLDYNGSNATISTDDPLDCDGTMPTTVLHKTMILGASCIPTSLLLPLLITYIGYKYFLVLSTLIPGIITLCLFLVQTSVQNLILSCLFESVTSVAISAIYCLLVDLYPTNLRAIATGLATFTSRVGGTVGNLMTGYLIDNYCSLLILLLAAQLILSGLLALFAPGRKKLEEEAKARSTEKIDQ
ncbi:hypothetical protein KM043_011039 [Ampulex compressa]|nr:hypothetical protein KM043_011039 [Ampulex compressa]